MALMSETVGSALELARARMAVLERSVTVAEKRALAVLGQTRSKLNQAPARLRSAFESVSETLRKRVAFATRGELEQISAKLDNLSRRVDTLIKKQSRKARADNDS